MGLKLKFNFINLNLQYFAWHSQSVGMKIKKFHKTCSITNPYYVSQIPFQNISNYLWEFPNFKINMLKKYFLNGFRKDENILERHRFLLIQVQLTVPINGLFPILHIASIIIMWFLWIGFFSFFLLVQILFISAVCYECSMIVGCYCCCWFFFIFFFALFNTFIYFCILLYTTAQLVPLYRLNSYIVTNSKILFFLVCII